eukprot:2202190-Pyramimonas_sp.AAC.1
MAPFWSKSPDAGSSDDAALRLVVARRGELAAGDESNCRAFARKSDRRLPDTEPSLVRDWLVPRDRDLCGVITRSQRQPRLELDPKWLRVNVAVEARHGRVLHRTMETSDL